MTDEEKAELERECYELEKYNCEAITFYIAGYEKGVAEGRKEYSESPCTSCCITESLESDLSELNYQFVNLSANAKQLEKENAELNRDKTELVNSVTELESKVAELGKQIKDFNLCGSSVAKSTYNEVVNENTVLKAKLQKVTDFVNSCSRSAVANMIKGILSE